jgi:hypothetical protein
MNAPSADNDDPWSWTVDDLIARVCQSRTLFQAVSCKAEDTPDAVALEAQLRRREVTGATFLTMLDSSTLQLWLGVQDPRHRQALIQLIEVLRQKSCIYKQHATTTGIQALYIDNSHSLLADRPLVNSCFANVGDRKRQKRTHVTTAPLPTPSQSQPSKTGDQSTAYNSRDFDYLLHWQQVDQYTDDEDLTFEEGEDDIEDEEEQHDSGEDDADMFDESNDVAQAPGRSKLRHDQIVDIINEQIERFTAAWEPNKGVDKEDEVEYDPDSMWEEAEMSGTRQRLIEKYEIDVAYYKQRLDKLCDEIVKAPGYNADQVQKQCRNLEVTVNSMELADWLLSIYKLDPEMSENEDEEEGEQEPNQAPPAEHGVLSSGSKAHQIQQCVEIVDLGSPSGSSESGMDGMLADGSPPPTALIEKPHSPSSGRFQTPDSVIADTIEPRVEVPPQLSPTTRTTSTSLQGVLPGDAPENASIASARRWKWKDLVGMQDRKRIVTKAVQQMRENDRETIRSRLETVGKADLIREIPACVRMLAKRENKMHGVLPRDLPKIVLFTKLFLCWWLCNNYFGVEPSKWHLEELEQCLREGSPDPSTFFDYLNTVMNTTFSPVALRHPEQPSQAEIIEISDDDDEPPSQPALSQRKSHIPRPSASQQSTTIVLD